MTAQSNKELTVMSRDINSLHQKAAESAENAVIYAIQCGQILIDVKQRVGHGNFLPWLADNFKGSQQTANSYMRVAANYAHASNLPSSKKPESIREALRQLSAPNEEETTELSELEKARNFGKKIDLLAAEANMFENTDIKGISDIPTLTYMIDRARSLEITAAKCRLHAERETGRLLNELQACGLSLGQINDLMQLEASHA